MIIINKLMYNGLSFKLVTIMVQQQQYQNQMQLQKSQQRGKLKLKCLSQFKQKQKTQKIQKSQNVYSVLTNFTNLNKWGFQVNLLKTSVLSERFLIYLLTQKCVYSNLSNLIQRLIYTKKKDKINEHTNLNLQKYKIQNIQKQQMDIKQNGRMVEMRSYIKQPIQQLKQLDGIQQKVLPNVLKLLGRYSHQKDVQFRLPTYSAFYLSPLSNITLAYNVVYIFVFYIIQIQISLILAFGPNFIQDQFGNLTYKLIYWLIFAFLIIDIFISFHKGYYQYGKGKICDNQRKIIKNYLKKQFYFDVITVSFLIIPRVNQNNQDIQFLMLFSLLIMWIKKFKYQAEVVKILQYQKTLRTVFILTVLFSDVLLIGHFGSCLFLFIDLTLWNEQYYGNNTSLYWLSNNSSYANTDLFGGLWYLQYIYAQSFSTGTLSTLAPGPFAKNPIEICFALFVMIYFMLFASYIGQILISILYSQQIKRLFHEQNVQDFDNYMYLKDISQNLKTRIHNFFQLVWDVQSRLQSLQQKQVINLLPLNLKEQLLVEMSFLRNFFFFKYIQDSRNLEKLLANKINRIIIDSDTCLFRQGSLIQNKNDQTSLSLNFIYYLSKGMVKYYVSLEKKHVYGNMSSTNQINFKSCDDGLEKQDINKDNLKKQYTISMSNADRFIGLYEFVTKKSFQYCCKVVDLCEIDSISREDFMSIITLSKNEQIYHKLRHEIVVQSKIQIINKVCSICYQRHIQEKCPVINSKQRIRNQIINTENNIGRNQERNINFDRDIIKNQKVSQSKRVKHKQRPKIETKRTQRNYPIFSQILLNSNIKLQELLFSVAKIDDIDESYIWRDYYPEKNIDRINFIPKHKLPYTK